jgi:hypothetical protein
VDLAKTHRTEALHWLGFAVIFASVMASACYVLLLEREQTLRTLRQELEEARQAQGDAMRALRSCRTAEAFRRGD